jgi:hypothetical protein
VPQRIAAGVEAARAEAQAHLARVLALERDAEAARAAAAAQNAAAGALREERARLTAALAEARVAQAASALAIVDLEARLGCAGGGSATGLRSAPAADAAHTAAASAVTPLRDPIARVLPPAALGAAESAKSQAEPVGLPGCTPLLDLLAAAATRDDDVTAFPPVEVAASAGSPAVNSVGAKRARPAEWTGSGSAGRAGGE